jgi:hypothetical protein
MSGTLQGQAEEVANVSLVLGDQDVVAQRWDLIAASCDRRELDRGCRTLHHERCGPAKRIFRHSGQHYTPVETPTARPMPKVTAAATAAMTTCRRAARAMERPEK